MSRNTPHPLALFSLVPNNHRTENVTVHLSNSHLAYKRTPGSDVCALDIGFHIRPKSRYTLATIGRADADVTVEASNISRTQVSFEILADSGDIMAYDRSTSQSTRFFGPTAMSFEPGRYPRRVIVAPGVNEMIGFGGSHHDLYQFQIVWHETNINVKHEVELQCENPRLARTIDDTDTVAPSHVTTRIHTPSTHKLRIRYIEGYVLGRGAFGVVRQALNVDSGDQMALKSVPWPKLYDVDPKAQKDFQLLKREVETLKSVAHHHIVEYIAAQKSKDEQYIEIFTLQKEGNIDQLILKDVFKDPKEAGSLLHQMLQAIDFLASRDIIHRDIKPGNILFTSSNTGYRYQLTDFGLSNLSSLACTVAGSPLFMAPEIWDFDGSHQSPKMDVWSLLVTLMHAVDIPSGFRIEIQRATSSGSFQNQMSRIRETVCAAAEDNYYHRIKNMANVDATKRSSAGDILDALFNGEGRTTKRIVSITRPTPQLEKSLAFPEKTDRNDVRKDGMSTPKSGFTLPTTTLETPAPLQRRQYKNRMRNLQRQLNQTHQGSGLPK